MVIAFTAGNFRFTYSTHLGVMCHPSTRCRRQRRSWNARSDTKLRHSPGGLLGDPTKYDPGDGLEIELAEQPVIFADVGVDIRRQDGGQPVLHVQLERGGDLRHNGFRKSLSTPQVRSRRSSYGTPSSRRDGFLRARRSPPAQGTSGKPPASPAGLRLVRTRRQACPIRRSGDAGFR
jgi:hypothetical protein